MKELLTCEGLTKSYQKGTNALDDIELHIGFGRIVGLLGPNGSGKTTLIKLANGLLQPTAGSIKIAGMDPGPDTKAIVSYLPDAAWLPDWMRVEQLASLRGLNMQEILQGNAALMEALGAFCTRDKAIHHSTDAYGNAFHWFRLDPVSYTHLASTAPPVP